MTCNGKCYAKHTEINFFKFLQKLRKHIVGCGYIVVRMVDDNNAKLLLEICGDSEYDFYFEVIVDESQISMESVYQISSFVNKYVVRNISKQCKFGIESAGKPCSIIM